MNTAASANPTAIATVLDLALAAFKRSPDAQTLLDMNLAAVPLLARQAAGVAPALPPAPAARPWVSITDPAAFADGEFSEIRAVADAPLTDGEVGLVAGTLGYALAETLVGEGLSDPEVSRPKAGAVEFTVLEFFFDSTKSRRSSPDFARAFEVASVYVFHGSRVRTTNRVGPRGSQAVTGLGPGRCNVSFYVR